VVVLDARTLETVETAGVRDRARFPYVPGYLSFREAPSVLRAFRKLERAPDLLMCDGHGRAHPRRFGLACHLGLWLDLPTIGCAKSRLIGTHAEPGRRRGCHRPLLDEGEVVGEVVRTRDGVRPVYVSVGHRIDLATARAWVIRLARAARLPEPIREAHLEVNRLRASAARAS
jgi:deoxyribonuclease V